MNIRTNSPLGDYKIKKIIKCFTQDIQASKSAKLLEINRNTINRYYSLFRTCIMLSSNNINEKLSGEFELDESYFLLR